MNNFLTLHTEATSDSVDIMYRSNGGVTECVEAVLYIDAVNRLGTGDYDGRPDEGTSVHLVIADNGNQGYFDYTSQHNVIIWRWLIATVFTLEVREESGTASVTDDTGNPSEAAVYSNGIAVMPLYPVAEHLAIANSIEGAAIERFGIEPGTERVAIFYRAMMDVEQRTLTPFGHETSAELHNNFIAELNENGTPAELMTH